MHLQQQHAGAAAAAWPFSQPVDKEAAAKAAHQAAALQQAARLQQQQQPSSSPGGAADPFHQQSQVAASLGVQQQHGVQQVS